MAIPTDASSRVNEQAVVLMLAQEHYGIDIRAIQEIIRVPTITRVPNAAPYVLGVTNLRGRVVPVIDMRVRLEMPCTPATIASRVIIVNLDEGDVGFWVDGVSEVLQISPEIVDPPQALAWLKEPELLRGVVKLEDKLVGLLDAERLLTTETGLTEAA